MLLTMTKVQIIGTKRCQAQTVRQLHRLGVVQVDSWHEARGVSQQRMTLTDEVLRQRERLAYTATRVEAVLGVLPAVEFPGPSEAEVLDSRSSDSFLPAVETDLAEVEPQTRALMTRRDQLEGQLASLPRYEASLRKLLPLIPALIDLEHYTVTAIWLERRYRETLSTISRQLEELTGGLCEVISQEVDPDLLAAVLIFPKTKTGPVGNLLGQTHIAQIRLPTEFAGQSLEQALGQMRQRLEVIPQELAELETQQKALAYHWRPRLLAWQALLMDYLAQIEVCANFGQTNYTFVIEGWVPKRRLAALQAALEDDSGSEVVITELPIRPEEQANVPVAFDNPLLVKPFEPLVGLLAWPRYGRFDPTPLMALFLPIFFGLMLGDIGYGVILLILLVYLRRRFRDQSTLRSLAEVLMIGSGWSIVFGFLFGECFGTLGEAIGLHPLWFDRGRDVEALFLLTIALGAGHIVLGLCLGMWEAFRQHKRHALMEKAATLVSLAALFLLVAVLADYLPDSFLTPAVALLLVGVAVLIYSLGSLGFFLGPLELVGLVGNILSYLRLAAIGLASVYLALVANELAGFFGNVLIGLIIAVLLHALNIALGAFSPTIQSLRLHYVEFFSQFYQGGGQPFRPFQSRSLVEAGVRPPSAAHHTQL
ncbi:MAG TPA: V-type ATP synthase subunit I [Anaerolineae bacterium]